MHNQDDVDPNVYSGDDPNGAMRFIAHLLLLQEQGVIEGEVGDDPESQEFAADVRQLNSGWTPGQAVLIPTRPPAVLRRVQAPTVPKTRSCPTTRPREAGSRRIRRASARGPDDPEPEPPGGAAGLLERLAANEDERIARWASAVERRSRTRETNLTREIRRLLEPWVAAGFLDANSLAPTPAALDLRLADDEAVTA